MAMPGARQFIETVAPFNQLSNDELRRVADSLTPARYGPGEMVLRRLTTPQSLFVVAEGVIEEADQAGPITLHASGGIFDSLGLINGRAENSFVSRSNSLCYTVPATLVQALSRGNVRFREFFQRDLGRRLDALVAVQQQREATSFLLARLREGDLHTPVFVAPETTIRQATQLMQSREVTAVLVRRGNEVGIFTERDVRERSVLMGLADSAAIGDLAHYDLYTLDSEDFLFSALVLMTERAIRHVVVTRDGEIEGIFEQADLLGYLSNSSYVIASRLDRSRTLEELKQASDALPNLVRSLLSRTVKPRYISRIITDLNRKVIRRVYELSVPPRLWEDTCLIVMGSEGRGEQILRTDQDNGLIFRSEPDAAERDALAEPITQALITLGYPPCPGNVMVTNPDWAKSVKGFRQDLRHWIVQPTGDALLRLAILYDASPVAGDIRLLTDIKARLFEMLGEEDAFASHFARATLAFPTPIGMFNRFILEEKTVDGAAGLDIKKGGIFPIVHGVRSLALAYRVTETNTIARIQSLSGRGPFSDAFTADLIEAFDFMAMLRLREQLAALDAGRPSDNIIAVERLHGFERSLLRNSLKIVKEFKADVSHHFRLSMLS